ncbi:DNA-binding protein WhiA [Oscillospiraceae bacterium OttesenSCG-928-G22]|nr:DNA-binding protein WhiA [Oscillospiraceae bacterium OttesenSCG-928-G22]
MISFSGSAKAEMTRARIAKELPAAAELYGGLLYASQFDPSGIKIVTESADVAARMQALLTRVFGFSFDETDREAKKSSKETLTLSARDKLLAVLERYGHETSGIPVLHLNAAVLEDDECRSSFLRGAFLVGGSVSTPEKDYHLELVTRHFHLSRELVALLLDMEFTPKSAVRKSNYVTYFKDSEQIEDFLTVCGAPASALELMEQKVEKDLRNRINRRVNCETANLGKAVNAAQEQIFAIRKLERLGLLASLPEKLRATADLRLSHPEATLGELLALSSDPISRSGLNHRLTKLVSLAADTPDTE